MTDPGFPFIGAGEASYFEWAEMFVCFERAPTKIEAEAIGKRVPPPLRDTITWTGPLLGVSSEQGVGRLIAAAYKRVPGTPKKLTTQSRFTMAPGSADARFNADIDAWLIAAHANVPILVAYRREDYEAGGTRLSDWHRASLAALPAVIATLARDASPELAKLAEMLVRAARDAKLPVDAETATRFAKLVEAAEEAEANERHDRWNKRLAQAAAALGEPQPPFTVLRTGLEPSLGKLDKALPATRRRLARMAANGLAVRPGATAAAIAAAEKVLGTKLAKEHRALLEAFDGGQIGDIVILGTAKGGSKGDAELATFSRAWCGDELQYVIVAQTARDNVIAIPTGNASHVFVFRGAPGSGGGTITRQCKTLDIALDLALKAGKVWNNLAT